MIKKSLFYKDYKISDSKPLDIARHYIRVSTVCQTVAKFLDDEFAGLFRLSYEPVFDKSLSVKICEDQLAYFFKQLLAAVYGRQSVAVDMKLGKNGFLIIISSEGHLPINPEEMQTLVGIAARIGMSCETENDTLTLRASLFRVSYASLRSISSDILKAKFVEIFFTGGPPIEYDE